MEAKVFRDILGYEGLYQISSCGIVLSVRGDNLIGTRNRKSIREVRAVSQQLNYRGYPKVGLCKDKKRTSHRVHRLVATAFIPNPENKKEVNHIDGNKANNHYSNLEWATHSENVKHAYDTGLTKKKRK
jgi:hypothetical protein